MNTLKRFTISLTALLLFSGVAMAMPPAVRHGPASDLAQQLRQQAQEHVQQVRAKGQAKSQAARQHACIARQAALTRRMNSAVDHAQKHKQVFDKIYTRVKDFYIAKKLNVTDYATLTAKADAAQASAATNVSALQSLDISIDCSSPDVASSVSAFQQAVKSTRDSLKSYRAALVDLINSLKGASTGTQSGSSADTTKPTNQ